MATWHQLKRPVTMFHQTLWTVVVDPPGECRSLITFGRERDALMHMRNLRTNQPRLAKHAFVLKPAVAFNASKSTKQRRRYVRQA
jgi:hypothetical protein